MKQLIIKAFIYLFLGLSTGGGHAQVNLIENPGFEDHWSCYRGTVLDTTNRTAHWTEPIYADSMNRYIYPSVPDSCDFTKWGLNWRFVFDNTQLPRSGNYFGAILTYSNFIDGINNYSDYRHYQQTKLKQPLVKDEPYYFEMYIKRLNWGSQNWGVLATNGQGIAFTEKFTRRNGQNTRYWHDQVGPIDLSNAVLMQSRDSIMKDTNWAKLVFCFQANGKEQFATIGNFLTAANLNKQTIIPITNTAGNRGENATYGIDDLRLIPLKIGLPRDTALCEGDTLVINARRNVPVSYLWSDGATDTLRKITKSAKLTLYLNYDLSRLGCKSEETINVTFIPKNLKTRIFDTVACDNKKIALKAGYGVPNEQVVWQPNNMVSPILNVNKAGNYSARVTNFCANFTDSFRVAYENCNINIFAPNAFTPNSDNNKDRKSVV